MGGIQMKNKKTVILLSTIIIASISLIFISQIKRSQIYKEVLGIEVVDTLNKADSTQAAKLIQDNTVRIINNINEKDSIFGTGFFHKSGYLITNSHVVDIKGDILVEYPDGVRSKATIVANNIISDLALLKVENSKGKALSFKSTIDLDLTSEVFALGYQYNLKGSSTITKGIVSAKRSASGIEFIQSDLSINPGASGGPLFNSYGELLGIITLADENASIAMAISSDSLDLLIDKMLSEKNVHYIQESRPQNALSSVLREVNYKTSDLYNENKYLIKKDDNPNKKEETIVNNNNTNDTNNNDLPINNNKPKPETETKQDKTEDHNINDYGRQLTFKRFEPVDNNVSTYFSYVGKDLTNCQLDTSKISHKGLNFSWGEVTLKCDQNSSIADVAMDNNPPKNQAVPFIEPNQATVPNITVGGTKYNVTSLDQIKGTWYLPGYNDVCMKFSYEVDAIFWHHGTINHFSGKPDFHTGGAAVFNNFEELLTQTTSLWLEGNALRINDTYTVIRTPGTGIYNWNNFATGCPIR